MSGPVTIYQAIDQFVYKIKPIMQKQASLSEHRRVKVISDYAGFDFFLIKKPLQCTLRIPETILLDKYGAPKEWIFNSGKLPHHPILKKRKQNLLPLLIIKSICSKYVNYSNIANFKSIFQLREYLKNHINQRKDAEYFNKKKSLQIRTANGEVLQLSLLQFLEYVGESKHIQQYFYQKWVMIQEKVSASKVDESYIVQSVRKNHIIQSKSRKYITVPTGSAGTIDLGGNDSFRQTIPSQQLQVADTKNVEAYKFFDTYLNKKFYSSVQQFIECVQKNFKCIVESLTTRFTIDHNRQPHIASIQKIYVKPSQKISDMKEFLDHLVDGEIKLDAYIKCLHQYHIQHPPRSEPNLHQPLSEQRGYKCKGEFCDAVMLSIPHISEQKFKLPLISTANTRKIGAALIESVKKRRSRVIEKLKQGRALDIHYNFQADQSSQYDDSDDQLQGNVKVCENCFIFYINVLKYFDLDAYNNLVQKKASSVRSKLFSSDSDRKNIQKSGVDKEEQNQLLLSKRHGMASLKNLRQRSKPAQDIKEQAQNMKRSASQHTKLRPVDRGLKPSKQAQEVKKEAAEEKNKYKQDQKQPAKEAIEKKANKLIEAKLSNAKSQSNQKQKPSKAAANPHNTLKPANLYQATEQLLNKLSFLPNSSVEEFINASKVYYTNNLPQSVDRFTFSSEYLIHLYQFMSNSPIATAPANRIKKRPQMTLKRLSQLTNYPEIVSRSTFIFNTIICDEKTTIPFCVISSSMVHHNNLPGQPYQNVLIFQDIFDSYIEFISISKQILEDTRNTRFILFNYPGQSHTIYDKNTPLRASEISSIVDKLIYRLSSEPNQLNIISKSDTLKIIGFGFGGYLTASFLSSCPALYSSVSGVTLVNAAFSMTQKYKSTYESLLSLYSVSDPTTQENAFLFYNKAIGSNVLSKQQLQDKSGLNSIRLEGRCYLLANAIEYWDDINHQNFVDYGGKVNLIYSKSNSLIAKADMLKFLYMPDADRTVIKSRTLIEIDGGHDVQSQNYEGLLKHISQFLS